MHGLAYPIPAGDYNLEDGTRTHFQAYQILRDALSAHYETGNEPVLHETEKPRGGRQWRPSEEIVRVFRDAGLNLFERQGFEIDLIEVEEG